MAKIITYSTRQAKTVKITKLPPKQPQFDDVNPFKLLAVTIDGKFTTGRPIEFDSEPVRDQIINGDGVPIKPTKLQSTCTECGTGVIVLVSSPVGSCPKCFPDQDKPDFAKLIEAFRNPVANGLVAVCAIPIAEQGKPLSSALDLGCEEQE